MLRLASLSDRALRSQLSEGSLALRTGPFVYRIRSSLPLVAEAVQLLYAEQELCDAQGFCDFHVRVDRMTGLRGWIRPQAHFTMDGTSPFIPMVLNQAAPMLEWGMNWCVTAHAHQYLVIHAAAIECQGGVAILPAPPGSGKSTLCAALSQCGWRLMSDELCLIDPALAEVVPIARPVSLKNRSINVIRDFAPQAEFSALVSDTIKGTVAHMKPPAEAVTRDRQSAPVRWVVLPKYEAGTALSVSPMSRSEGLLELAHNAFNYHLLGATGFDLLCQAVDQAQVLRLSYSRLDEAKQLFEALASGERIC